MWQVLAAAAAAAGSAILAKKLNPAKPFSGVSPNDQEDAQNVPSQSQESIFRSADGRANSEPMGGNEGEIFRFSSLEKGSRESEESGLKRANKNKKGKKKGKVKAVDQRAYASGKRVCVCLKKRRTSTFVAGKCASKDNAFKWGVGIGIMYMMSAGKIAQELKSDIPTRPCEPLAVAEDEYEADEMDCPKSCDSQGFNKMVTEEKNKSKILQHPSNQDNGSAGGVLTEGPQQPDVLEMDQLQAELEFELQKLPWRATESSGSEGRNDTFFNDHRRGCSENSYPNYGISPVELNRKLSTLLIEQQENQIVELESELQVAHRLLHEKEAELRALRDCVRGLTQLSVLGAPSDEETEDTHKKSSGFQEGHGSDDETMVGMKRSLNTESLVM